jgi:tetratricopeptide (TPR) repeat protein
MDDDSNTFELIERFIAQDLSPEELLSFEERLRTDKFFAQEVENQRLTHKATDIYAQLKTKEKVKENYDAVLKSEKNNLRMILSIAAAISILIIAGFGYFAPANYSNQALADVSFEVYPDRISTMGTATDAQLAAGMKAYNEKDFEKAIELFSKLPDTPQKNLINLYSGIAFMEINQFEKANTIFRQLTDSNSPQLEVARWYLALNYLKSNDLENAKLLLNQIVTAETYQSKNAAQLLKKLDNPLRKLPWVR